MGGGRLATFARGARRARGECPAAANTNGAIGPPPHGAAVEATSRSHDANAGGVRRAIAREADGSSAPRGPDVIR